MLAYVRGMCLPIIGISGNIGRRKWWVIPAYNRLIQEYRQEYSQENKKSEKENVYVRIGRNAKKGKKQITQDKENY